MPLPWLIGIAAVAVVGAITAAVNSDDTPSSSTGSNDDEERRRREAAAQHQRTEERETKRKNAQVMFKERGTQIGERLVGALDGWVDVAGEPGFRAKLTASGYSKRPLDQVVPHELGDVLTETFSGTDDKLQQIMGDLDFFNEVYDVRLGGSTRLYTTLMEIQSVDKDLADLAKLSKKLERIRNTKLEETSNMAEAAK